VTHPTLDANSVQAQIASQLSARYPVASPHVVCPSGVPASKGQTFLCTATLDGQTLDLDGTVTSGGGHFTISPTEAIIVVDSSTAQLTARIDSQTGAKATVSCGTRSVLVVPVGQTFSCMATFPGQHPRAVTVTVIDIQGHLDVKLAPAPAPAPAAST
jgi:Domain of unknown function (DUF4333)